MSEELSVAKSGLRVAIVSAVIAFLASYLALASDNRWWPFGAGIWIPTTVSVLLFLVALVMIFRLLISGGFTSLSVSAVRVHVLVLTLAPALATGLVVPVWAGGSELVKPAAMPKVTIDSPGGGSTQGSKMEVSGKIEVPLRSGQVIFVAARPNVHAGLGEPDRYTLQPGPCEIHDGGRAWRCGNVDTHGKPNSPWQIVVLGAEGCAPADFGVRLRLWMNYAAAKAADPNAEDPSILHGLPIDVMEFSRVSVKIRSS